MVCTKLDSGSCLISDEMCSEPYEIKMIKFQSCPVFKSRGDKLSLHARKLVSAAQRSVNKIFTPKAPKPAKKRRAKRFPAKASAKKSVSKASKSKPSVKSKSKAKKKKR